MKGRDAVVEEDLVAFLFFLFDTGTVCSSSVRFGSDFNVPVAAASDFRTSSARALMETEISPNYIILQKAKKASVLKVF